MCRSYLSGGAGAAARRGRGARASLHHLDEQRRPAALAVARLDDVILAGQIGATLTVITLIEKDVKCHHSPTVHKSCAASERLKPTKSNRPTVSPEGLHPCSNLELARLIDHSQLAERLNCENRVLFFTLTRPTSGSNTANVYSRSKC